MIPSVRIRNRFSRTSAHDLRKRVLMKNFLREQINVLPSNRGSRKREEVQQPKVSDGSGNANDEGEVTRREMPDEETDKVEDTKSSPMEQEDCTSGTSSVCEAVSNKCVTNVSVVSRCHSNGNENIVLRAEAVETIEVRSVDMKEGETSGELHQEAEKKTSKNSIWRYVKKLKNDNKRSKPLDGNPKEHSTFVKTRAKERSTLKVRFRKYFSSSSSKKTSSSAKLAKSKRSESLLKKMFRYNTRLSNNSEAKTKVEKSKSSKGSVQADRSCSPAGAHATETLNNDQNLSRRQSKRIKLDLSYGIPFRESRYWLRSAYGDSGFNSRALRSANHFIRNIMKQENLSEHHGHIYINPRFLHSEDRENVRFFKCNNRSPVMLQEGASYRKRSRCRRAKSICLPGSHSSGLPISPLVNNHVNQNGHRKAVKRSLSVNESSISGRYCQICASFFCVQSSHSDLLCDEV